LRRDLTGARPIADGQEARGHESLRTEFRTRFKTELKRVDAAEDERYGLQSPSALPPDLADAKARHQRWLEVKRLRAKFAELAAEEVN